MEIILQYLYSFFLWIYWPGMVIYIVFQFYTNNNIENSQKKQANFIGKIIMIICTYCLISGGVYQYTYHNLLSFIEYDQSKYTYIWCSIGIVLLEVLAFIVTETDNYSRIVIARFPVTKKLLLFLHLSVLGVLILHLLLKAFYRVNFGIVIWRVELFLSFFIPIIYEFISSFNIMLSSRKEYLCVNNVFSQSLLISDDSHPYTFVQNSDNSFTISNGENSINTFPLKEYQIAKLKEL
jgi:hypothetical protein